SKTFVLEDIAGLGLKKSIFHKVKNAPYRFHESLGVIWRHRTCVNKNEKAVITGSLFHQDVQGKTLINSYIKHSGLTVQEWLKRYFKVVVSPLFHLQDKYGVGLVSHGQNIVLILENFVPVGMYLKDFHGDLRVSNEDALYFQSELRQRLAAYLDQLPPEYLIHDLITGHMITVLRFISAGLREEGVIEEQTFYDILSESISEYIKEHGLINQKINLQETHIKRVLLNKVRFQIGYNDSAERPKPALGTDLINPLHKHASNEKRNGKTNV
ncbi:MAG: IucA/IucC family C-terminal-domain containing protein, partial [Pseudobdellovibrio sp.]